MSVEANDPYIIVIEDGGQTVVVEAGPPEVYLSLSAPGPQGPQGIQGEPGEKGDQGEQGDQGTAGAQGTKGDTGETGVIAATSPATYDAGTKTIGVSVGNTSGTVAAGNDSRLSDTRDPKPHSHGQSDIMGLTTALNGKVDSSDSRLTNARTPTAHTHPATDITGLSDAISSKEDKSAKDQPSGYAGLNSLGKIATSALPPLAITSVSTAANEVAQLASGAQEGDVVIRLDQSKSYIHNGGSAGTMADFTELVVAPDLVQSVAGKTGTVTLDTSDISGLSTALAGKVDTSDSRLSDTRDPKAHTHSQSDVTGLDTALSGKANTSHTHSQSDVTGLGDALAGKANTSHSHAIGDVTNLQTSLDDKAASSDSRFPSTDQKSGLAGTSGTPSDTNRYVTNSDSRLSDTRDPKAHTHPISDVTNLQTTLDGKVGTSDSRLTDARTPTAHKSTHATGGSDALSPSDIGAAASSHTHTLSNITDAGTAASKNVATSGNASSTQVVKGDDTRLAASGIWAWGSNSNGRLGNGVSIGTTTWASLIDRSAWKIVSLNNTASYGIKTDGTLWSWGGASNGRLGNGTTTPDVRIPTQVGSSSDWSIVEACGAGAAAIKTDGTLWTWGQASSGLLGNGTTTPDVTTPTKVGTDTDWLALSCGSSHILALKTDGTLWSWGYRANGRLGDGSTATTYTSTPTKVGTDTNWTAISAGAAHSLAIKSGGTLWSCGLASNGRLGNNSTTPDVSTLTQVGTATDWLAVSAGQYHNLGIKTDGTLWSWGTAAQGILGNNTTTPDVLVPTQVSASTGWTLVAAGQNRSNGIRNGAVFSWGSGPLGANLGSAINMPEMLPLRDGCRLITRATATSDAVLALF